MKGQRNVYVISSGCCGGLKIRVLTAHSSERKMAGNRMTAWLGRGIGKAEGNGREEKRSLRPRRRS